jgi:hypothetical protein
LRDDDWKKTHLAMEWFLGAFEVGESGEALEDEILAFQSLMIDFFTRVIHMMQNEEEHLVHVFMESKWLDRMMERFTSIRRNEQLMMLLVFVYEFFGLLEKSDVREKVTISGDCMEALLSLCAEFEFNIDRVAVCVIVCVPNPSDAHMDEQ